MKLKTCGRENMNKQDKKQLYLLRSTTILFNRK